MIGALQRRDCSFNHLFCAADLRHRVIRCNYSDCFGRSELLPTFGCQSAPGIDHLPLKPWKLWETLCQVLNRSNGGRRPTSYQVSKYRLTELINPIIHTKEAPPARSLLCRRGNLAK